MASGSGPTPAGGYEKSDGTTIDTGTESGVTASLSDIAHRLMALETAPKPVSTGDAADEGRIARIEAVVLPYFRDQAASYDEAAAARAAAAAGTDTNAGAGTSGATTGAAS